MTRAAPDRWSAGRAALPGWLALIVLIGGVGAWATGTTLAGAIVAPGVVEAGRGAVPVQHPDGGIVAAVLVADGQEVRQGQILLRLDDADVRASEALIRLQLAEARARRARLEAERDGLATLAPGPALEDLARVDAGLAAQLDGEQRLFLARRAELDTAAAQLRQQARRIGSQIAGLRRQAAAIERQRRLLLAEIATQRGLLAQGLAQAGRLSLLEREAAALDGALGEVSARIAEAEVRISEVDLAILYRHADRREAALAELRRIGPLEEDLTARLGALTRQAARMALHAPVAGVVHDLRVAGPHTVVGAGDPLVFVVPQDALPVIAAHIPAHDVAGVTAGQPVMLRLPAMDRMGREPLDGRVATVSADAFADPATGARFFRVEVVPDAAGLALSPPGTLRPGLPVEVYFRTRDRSPAAYLVEPLAGYFRRALREG